MQAKMKAIPDWRLLSNRDADQTQRSNSQVAQNRNMVGGFFPPSNLAFYGAADEPVGSLRRQQDVVDSDAVVLNPCTRLIIPKCVAMRLGMAGEKSIGKAEV